MNLNFFENSRTDLASFISCGNAFHSCTPSYCNLFIPKFVFPQTHLYSWLTRLLRAYLCWAVLLVKKLSKCFGNFLFLNLYTNLAFDNLFSCFTSSIFRSLYKFSIWSPSGWEKHKIRIILSCNLTRGARVFSLVLPPDDITIL